MAPQLGCLRHKQPIGKHRAIQANPKTVSRHWRLLFSVLADAGATQGRLDLGWLRPDRRVGDRCPPAPYAVLKSLYWWGCVLYEFYAE